MGVSSTLASTTAAQAGKDAALRPKWLVKEPNAAARVRVPASCQSLIRSACWKTSACRPGARRAAYGFRAPAARPGMTGEAAEWTFQQQSLERVRFELKRFGCNRFPSP
jgi:hypothetical protein